MFRIAFGVISAIMFISIMFLQWRLFAIGIGIRESNKNQLKYQWSDFGFVKSLKRIAETTKDESTKKLIADYLKYRKIQSAILLGGLLLLLLVGLSNSVLNKAD